MGEELVKRPPDVTVVRSAPLLQHALMPAPTRTLREWVAAFEDWLKYDCEKTEH